MRGRSPASRHGPLSVLLRGDNGEVRVPPLLLLPAEVHDDVPAEDSSAKPTLPVGKNSLVKRSMMCLFDSEVIAVSSNRGWFFHS